LVIAVLTAPSRYLHTPKMAKKPPQPPEVMQRLTDSDFRWLTLWRYRRKNAIVGLSILAGVLGIYTYSMWAVKQKDFLDEEFNKPGPSSPSNRTTQNSRGGTS